MDNEINSARSTLHEPHRSIPHNDWRSRATHNRRNGRILITMETPISSYGDVLEELLNVSAQIDEIDKLFNIFLEESKYPIKKPRNEAQMLSMVKNFFNKRKSEIQNIRDNSILSNSDCISLSTIACLLSNRRGFNTRVAHPKPLTRSLHALLIQDDGTPFQIAGKYRNYVTRILEPEQVVQRIKLIKPLFDITKRLGITLRSSR